MKVKNLSTSNGLKYEEIYNVFSIGETENKYYISDYEESGKYYLSPFNIDDFEIVDTTISKFWNYGLDKFGEKVIGIPEILDIKYFWESYYNDDLKIKSTLDLYYRNGKRELFNIKMY